MSTQSTTLRLRPAIADDASLVYEWRNRPEIVALSSTGRPVSWDEHAAFFRQTVVAPDRRRMFLVLLDGCPIGQVRFDRREPDTCEVSVYLLPERTGRGLGVTALRMGCDAIFRQWPVARIVALVREENTRSLKAFHQAGFSPADKATEWARPHHAELHLPRPAEMADAVTAGDDWERHKSAITRFYDELGSRHGTAVQACGWGRAESQRVRFEVLSQVLPLAGRRVLDVGCGFADFADFLRERHGALVYEGVDINPRIVEEARRRHPGLSLHVADILREDPGGPYDVVTASGIFYVPAQGAEARMRELIARMLELATEAIAFSSLSAWAPRREPEEFYADPVATVEFCRTLTPWVVLRHDYLPHDFTVYAYRRARP